jgi:hypothetical protein
MQKFYSFKHPYRFEITESPKERLLLFKFNPREELPLSWVMRSDQDILLVPAIFWLKFGFINLFIEEKGGKAVC